MNDIYKCDFCGFQQGWEDSDDTHGEMWSCEICGKIFCSKCLEKYFGSHEGYLRHMQTAEVIMCPDCQRRY